MIHSIIAISANPLVCYKLNIWPTYKSNGIAIGCHIITRMHRIMHRIKTHVNPTVRESCSTSACVRLRPCDSRRTILDWEQFLHFLRISC